MSRLVVVTGGAGFIGSALVRALLERGDRVRVLDDLSAGRRENLEGLGGDLELIVGSILDKAALARVADGAEVIFHLAAQVSVPRSFEDPETTDEVNARGTLRVYEAGREARVRRVVFSSTCAVYGNLPDLPKHEESPLDPSSPYAGSKLAGERFGEIHTREPSLEVVSLRYFNVFGPRQRAEGGYAAAIPIFLKRALEGAPLRVDGDGLQTRDFVHVDYVVDANLRAAEAPAAPGRVFNIGSGEETSILALAEAIREGAGSTSVIEHRPLRAGDIRRSVADVSAARQLLGWQPPRDLAHDLRRTLDAARAERAAASAGGSP